MCPPVIGASLKPHSRVPRAIPTAPKPREVKPMCTVAVTTPVDCRSRISVRTPTEVRALLAP